MARGWESKEVESQIDAAERRSALRQKTHESEAERDRRQLRESLLLTRSRVLHDLENATKDRYRATLEAALAHVDQQLATLGPLEQPPTKP